MRTALITLAVTAAVPSAARAMPAPDPIHTPARHAHVQAPAPATAAAPDARFEWGDAAIGAAGVVLLIGSGGMAATAARRRHRPLAS